MEEKIGQNNKHAVVKEQYDDVQSDGRYQEGMARMALYHRHCQDPVIFRTLGDIRGKALLDLACGDGFYTRRFRSECGADPVLGIDLSPKQIERARASGGVGAEPRSPHRQGAGRPPGGRTSLRSAPYRHHAP